MATGYLHLMADANCLRTLLTVVDLMQLDDVTQSWQDAGWLHEF